MVSRDNPRLHGIREHFERAQFLFGLAVKEENTKAGYRLLLSAIYSCRGITEVMLEAADKQEVTVDRKTLESQLQPMLPYYALIERIRIHDFHRIGIVPPDPSFRQTFLSGPIKLTARSGIAAVTITQQKPQMLVTGGSKINEQRPLIIQNGDFFDDDSSRYTLLTQESENP